MSERPFSLHVSDLEIDTLRKKLELTRLPDELDESAWDYGAPLEDIRRLLARWKDGFDWRAYETTINEFSQFTRDIDVEGFGTLDIHYVHQRSKVEGAIPLLLIHGWPGHFMEVHKLLHLLVSPTSGQPCFHVVVPSLPGYGFSEAPKKKGFAGAQYAEVANKLMLSLGYNQYVVQGSFMVARKLGLSYGQHHVKAWHTSFIAVTKPPSFTSNPTLYLQHLLTPYTPRDRAGLARSTWFRAKSTGYMAEQSTQPQTLGYSLADSPIGLLAWVYEKLVQWTDSYPWTDDEVLQWVSIHWFSRAGPAAALRIYYEFRVAEGFFKNQWTPVPIGLSFFPKEILVVPKTWARTMGNVVFESEHESGGHFASYEKPEELACDLRKMFGKNGPVYGAVKGKDGYA